MKSYINKFLLIVAVFSISACSDFDSFLDNPNAVSPDKGEVGFLMNSAMIRFEDLIDNATFSSMAYVRMLPMTGSRTYEAQDAPTSFNFLWRTAYAELIPDIDAIIAGATPANNTLMTGIAKTMKAYTLMTMVDLFGDIPYSEAFKGNANTNPKADKGADLYAIATALLDDAIKDLSAPKGLIPEGDIFYPNQTSVAGKGAAWKKAATSLKLRSLIQTRLVANNKDAVQALLAGDVIKAVGDDFQVNYSTNRANPDSRHPLYIDAYEANGAGVYLSNYYMWMFFGDKKVEDPRLRYYFYRQDCDETNEDAFTLGCVTAPYPSHYSPDQRTPFCTASFKYGDPNNKYGGYWGRDHGDNSGTPPDQFKRTAVGAYPAGGPFDADNCAAAKNGGVDGNKGAGITPVVTSFMVDFMAAEAMLTMGVTGDAKATLEKGIRGSISKTIAFAGGTDGARKPKDSVITEYVKEVLARYDSATTPALKLNVVLTEAYLAAWGNGLDPYNTYRRTGMPRNMQPSLEPNPGKYARSMWYPSDFVNLNSSTKQKSNVDIKVFWDTNTEDLK
jgi:hypothetical protein